MAEEETARIKKIVLDFMRSRRMSANKIIIFGSYAHNANEEDSDIDLLIVSKHFRKKDVFERVSLMGDMHVRLVQGIGKPFDILYYSDEEWMEGRSLIIDTAKREGEVIYVQE